MIARDTPTRGRAEDRNVADIVFGSWLVLIEGAARGLPSIHPRDIKAVLMEFLSGICPAHVA